MANVGAFVLKPASFLYEVCLQTCLNGIIDPGEDCDDANTAAGAFKAIEGTGELQAVLNSA